MAEKQNQSWFEMLGKIEDPRKDKGKRHPLQAILATVAVAMLCGYRSYGAIAEWGRNYGEELTQLLGFTRKETPVRQPITMLS